MNSKKVNWLFLSLILIDLAWIALMLLSYLFWDNPIDIPITANFILSEAFIMLPALLFVLTSRRKTRTGSINELLGFHRMKLSSFFMVILFTFLIMPMSTAINAISMLFVDNAVNAVSGDVLQVPFPVMLFLIGIFGPFCEEFVFRGVIFRGYKNTGPVLWAIFWSSLLFALMHLNFNQAAYAIAIGIMFGLLVEATGSLWSSAIAHMVFNSQQVCMMYLLDYLPESYASETLTQDMLIAAIGPYLIAAAVATPIAVCVIVWLAGNENREDKLRSIWACRKDRRGSFVSIPLIIAIVISLAYMSLEWIMELVA